MNTKIKKDFEYTSKNSNKEELALLLYTFDGQLNLFRFDNRHSDTNTFNIEQNEYLTALKLGKPLAFFHSHLNGISSFSEADLIFSEEWELPLRLYNVKENEWNEFIPQSYRPELEGQPFCWGEKDCYGAVREYFRQKYNLYLADFDRDENFLRDNDNIIVKNFESQGFEKLAPGSPIKKDDVFVTKHEIGRPHHFMIFQGNNRVFHHKLGRRSNTQSINGAILQQIDFIARLKV